MLYSLFNQYYVKKIIFYALLPLCLTLMVSYTFPGVMEKLDLQGQDLLIAAGNALSPMSGRDYPSIVQINLTDNKDSWDRNLYAQIVRNCAQSKPVAILLNVIFRVDDSGKASQALSAAVAQAGNVYLPVSFRLDGPSHQEISTTRVQSYRDIISGSQGQPPVGRNVLTSYSQLQNLALGEGHVNLVPDADGCYRRVPLLIRYQGAFVPALQLKAVMDYLRVAPSQVVVDWGHTLTLKQALLPTGMHKDIVIPIDQHGNMRINFRVHADKISTYSYAELLNSNVFLAKIQSQLQHKFILISDTWQQAATPMNPRGLSSSLNLAVLSSLLQQQFIREASPISSWMLAASFLCLVVLVCVVIPGRYLVVVLAHFGYVLLLLFLYMLTSVLVRPAICLFPVLFASLIFLLCRVQQGVRHYSDIKKKSEEAQFWITHDIKNDLAGLLLFMQNAFPDPVKQTENFRRLGELTQVVLNKTKEKLVQYKRDNITLKKGQDTRNHIKGLLSFMKDSFADRLNDNPSFSQLFAYTQQILLKTDYSSSMYQTPESIPIRGIIQDVQKALLPVIFAKNIQLNFQEKSGFTIFSSRAELIELFKSVIQNALDYSPMNATVRIVTDESSHHYEVVIADEGIGIERQYVAKIFDPGFSIDDPRKTQLVKEKSTGIGLYNCKKIMEKFKGEIIVQPNRPCGTIFTLLFHKNTHTA